MARDCAASHPPLLTLHARALIAIDGGARMNDVAARLSIPPEVARAVVRDLIADGYVREYRGFLVPVRERAEDDDRLREVIEVDRALHGRRARHLRIVR